MNKKNAIEARLLPLWDRQCVLERIKKVGSSPGSSSSWLLMPLLLLSTASVPASASALFFAASGAVLVRGICHKWRQTINISIILGHWNGTKQGESDALESLKVVAAHCGSEIVFSGGDAESIEEEQAPMVVQAVDQCNPKLHLAFQHVRYLHPMYKYHKATIFLPHAAFLNEEMVHSGSS